MKPLRQGTTRWFELVFGGPREDCKVESIAKKERRHAQNNWKESGATAKAGRANNCESGAVACTERSSGNICRRKKDLEVEEDVTGKQMEKLGSEHLKQKKENIKRGVVARTE